MWQLPDASLLKVSIWFCSMPLASHKAAFEPVWEISMPTWPFLAWHTICLSPWRGTAEKQKVEFNHHGLEAIEVPTSVLQWSSPVPLLWEGSFLHLTETVLVFKWLILLSITDIINVKLNDAVDDNANFSKLKNTRLFPASLPTRFMGVTYLGFCLHWRWPARVEHDDVHKLLSLCLTHRRCAMHIGWPTAFTLRLIQILSDLEDPPKGGTRGMIPRSSGDFGGCK